MGHLAAYIQQQFHKDNALEKENNYYEQEEKRIKHDDDGIMKEEKRILTIKLPQQIDKKTSRKEDEIVECSPRLIMQSRGTKFFF